MLCKRQKSCTLIVIWVKCLYVTPLIFNSLSESNRIFFIAKEEVLLKNDKIDFGICNIVYHMSKNDKSLVMIRPGSFWLESIKYTT